MLLLGATASISPAPMPPTPTPAMFSFSLGGVLPLPATTWRGTIVNAATAVPAVRTKARRVRVPDCFFMLAFRCSIDAVASPPGITAAVRLPGRRLSPHRSLGQDAPVIARHTRGRVL